MGTATSLLVSQLAVGAIGAVGSVQQAQAAKDQGRYEGAQFDTNARLAGIQAEDAITRGAGEAGRVKLASRQHAGAQKAAAAAGGVDASTGSAAAAQEQSLALGELDAMTVRSNAYREAWGHGVQQLDFRTRARMARAGGRSNAGATIATGGMQFAQSAIHGEELYEKYRDKTDRTLYVRPPAGKNMSDPRNR